MFKTHYFAETTRAHRPAYALSIHTNTSSPRPVALLTTAQLRKIVAEMID